MPDQPKRNPAVNSLQQLIQERQGINETLGRMAQPQVPTQPPTLPTGPKLLNNMNIPGVQSLIDLMQKSGYTPARTEDIELQEGTDDLLKRARAIQGF
mgnify:CR=1 FL=1